MTSVKTRPGYSKAQKKRTYIKVPRILAMSHLIWIKKVSLPRTRYRLKRLVFLNWLRCFDYFLKNNGLQHSLLLSPVLDYMQPKETTSSPYFQSSLAQGGAHRKSFTSHSLVVNPQVSLSTTTYTTEYTMFVALFGMERGSWHADKMNYTNPADLLLRLEYFSISKRDSH